MAARTQNDVSVFDNIIESQSTSQLSNYTQEGLVSRSLSGGVDETIGSIAQGVEAIAGNAGWEGIQQSAANVAHDAYADAQTMNPSQYNKLSDINDVGDFFEAGAEMFLRSSPGLVVDALAALPPARVAALTARAASFAGKAMSVGDIVKTATGGGIIGKQMKRLLGEQMSDKLGKLANPKVAGAIAGATAAQGVQNIGDARNEMLAEGVDNAGLAIDTGLQNTAIDVAATAAVGAPMLKQLLGNGSKPGAYRSATKAVAGGATVGAGTEFGQWANTQDSIQQEYNSAGKEYEYMTREKLDSGLLEALGGASTSGALAGLGQVATNLTTGKEAIASGMDNVVDFFKQPEESNHSVKDIGKFFVDKGIVSQEQYDNIASTISDTATATKTKIMEMFNISKEKADQVLNAYRDNFVSDMDDDTKAYADDMYQTAEETYSNFNFDVDEVLSGDLDTILDAVADADVDASVYTDRDGFKTRKKQEIQDIISTASASMQALRSKLDNRKTTANKVGDMEDVASTLTEVQDVLDKLDAISPDITAKLFDSAASKNTKNDGVNIVDANNTISGIVDSIKSLTKNTAVRGNKIITQIANRTKAPIGVIKRVSSDLVSNRKQLAAFITEHVGIAARNAVGHTKSAMTPDEWKKRADVEQYFTPELHNAVSDDARFAEQVIQEYMEALKDNGKKLMDIKAPKLNSDGTLALDAQDLATHNAKLAAKMLMSALRKVDGGRTKQAATAIKETAETAAFLAEGATGMGPGAQATTNYDISGKLSTLKDSTQQLRTLAGKISDAAGKITTAEKDASVKETIQDLAFTVAENKNKREMLANVDAALDMLDSTNDDFTKLRDELTAYKNNIENGDKTLIANNRKNIQKVHGDILDNGGYNSVRRKVDNNKKRIKKSAENATRKIKDIKAAKTAGSVAKAAAKTVKDITKNTGDTINEAVDDFKSEYNDNSDVADTRTKKDYIVRSGDPVTGKPDTDKGMLETIAQRRMEKQIEKDQKQRDDGTLENEYDYKLVSVGKKSNGGKEMFVVERTIADVKTYKPTADSAATTRTKSTSNKSKIAGGTKAMGSIVGAKLTKFVNTSLEKLNMGNINVNLVSGGNADKVIADLGLHATRDKTLIRRIKEDMQELKDGKKPLFFGRVYMNGDAMTIVVNPKMPQAMQSVVVAHELGEAHFELNYDSLRGSAKNQLSKAYKKHIEDNPDIETSTYNEREFYADQVASFLHDKQKTPNTLLERVAKKLADTMRGLYELAMRTAPDSIKKRMKQSDSFVRFIDLVLSGDKNVIDESKAKENFGNAVYRNYTGEEAVDALTGK